MMTVIETLGWYGTLAILGAYFLCSMGKLDPRSGIYQFLNLSGALGLIAISVERAAWQPAVLNGVWAAIGLVALLRARSTATPR